MGLRRRGQRTPPDAVPVAYGPVVFDDDPLTDQALIAQAVAVPRLCQHVGWLTGRAAALRLDADRVDRDSITAATTKAQTILSDKAHVYRMCALELDNLASELGQDQPEPPPDASWVTFAPVHSREATGA